MAQGGNCPAGECRLLQAYQRTQHFPRADLQEDAGLILRQQLDAISETNRITQVCDPVLRVDGLLVTEPLTTEIGNDRYSWLVQVDTFQVGPEGAQDWIQQVRVRRYIDRYPLGVDAIALQRRHQRFDRLNRA